MTASIVGEIESPRPLRARDGEVEIRGWCLTADKEAPPVRLSSSAGILTATSRESRQDVAGGDASPACGFVISGRLPPGVHWAEFQAQDATGAWNTFRGHALRVDPIGLDGAVESHLAGTRVSTRTHVHGWIQPRDGTITSLELRYGHSRIPCDLGGNRDDAANRPSGATARAFKSRTILGAGHGPLRLAAKLSDGSTQVMTTSLTIDIAIDENHGPALELSGPRLGLVRGSCPVTAAPTAAAAPLNVCYILHGSFAANSALHVAALANELQAAGHDCCVAVTHDLETLGQLQAPAFRALLHAEALTKLTFANGRGPDVIHAWTTREQVRQLAEPLRSRHGCALVVHLEDNEQAILAATTGRAYAELAALPDAELEPLLNGKLSHPRHGPAFLAAADGVTLLNERLADFVPPGPAQHLFWPAADDRYFCPLPRPAEFRALWSRRTDECVLFYHGNVHAANAGEMRELYLAVAQLNSDGVPVTLLRTGLDAVDFQATLPSGCLDHVVSLGLISGHHHLPALMALADIFVQPGSPDAFNDYRFPSKLPEFFAIGRPVILPRTNLGTAVRHGEDAWVLERADAAGIAGAIRTLRDDSALRERLGRGAAAFSREHFSWRCTAEKLALFYARIAR